MILDVLRYEFLLEDRLAADRRIKRRLRYAGLGPYQQERVDVLRRLKDEVECEVRRRKRSRYYLGPNGGYAALEDFDISRMVADWVGVYPAVQQEALTAFIESAVFIHYMR